MVSGSERKFSEETRSFFRREQDIDIIGEFNALKNIGEMPAEQVMDRVALMHELNSAAVRARRANLIFLKARRERELFRIEFDATMKSLSNRAIQFIEIWLKENEVTKKQITKDMVEQEIASNPELVVEYRVLIEKQEELRSIQDDCQLLANEWSERKRTLQTQARLLSAEKEVVFGKGGPVDG